MNSTSEALQLLYKIRDELSQKLNQANQAINFVESLANGSLSDQPSDNFTPTDSYSKKEDTAAYPKEKLDKLIQQGYHHKWRYPEKLMFLLKTYGEMYIEDMVNKIKELHPTITEKDILVHKRRMGYQAMELAKKGIINRRRDTARRGVKVKYWLKD